MSTRQGERNRDRVMQKLHRYTDEERWFAERDFRAAVHEAGFDDPRTAKNKWESLKVLGIIETVQLRDGVVMGRMSAEIYGKLEAHGTTLPIAADIKIIGRAKRSAQLISAEEMV